MIPAVSVPATAPCPSRVVAQELQSRRRAPGRLDGILRPHEEPKKVRRTARETPPRPDQSVHGSGLRPYAYHWVVILTTPFLQLAINPNLFITPHTNASIDTWVYTGFFLSLPEHLQRWGQTYYATRLSWLLPGFAAHNLFSPVVAAYVLHLTFFYILLFAVYSMVTAGANRSTAFVITLLVAWNPELLSAMSWDYVDGAVITYFTLALLCLEKASSRSTPGWSWEAGAGAALACMACANLVAVTLWPICWLFFFLRVGAGRWRHALATLAVASFGAGAMFVVFAVANRLLGGQWLFLLPSVTYAGTMMWLPSPWDVEGVAWLKDAPFLVLPAVAAFGALFSLSSGAYARGSFGRAMQLTFLVAVSWWVVHSALWTHSIHVSYYTSYLVPLGLLVLALQPLSPLAGSTTPRPRPTVALELAALGALIAAHLLAFRHGDYTWTAAANVMASALPNAYPFNAIMAFAVCVLAIVSLGFIRATWCRWPVFLLLWGISYGSVPTNWPTVGARHVREDFALTASAHAFIGQHLDRNKGLRMWYRISAGEPRPFRNISSTYLWGWTLINEEMPSLLESQVASIQSVTQLVLLVGDRAETDAARQALQRFGLAYAPRVQRRFGVGGSTLWVVIGDVSRVAPPTP